MDVEVLGDLVAPSRRSDAVAYQHDEPARAQSYDNLCTTAWQTANLLRLYGVHEGATVGIVDAPKHPDRPPEATDGRTGGTPIPEVLTTMLGTSLLGAVVRFEPDRSFEGSALVCPADWSEHYTVSPDCTVLAYGGPPTSPSVIHLESEVWSETPIAPPESIDPGTAALAVDGQTFDHATLLSAAKRTIGDHGIEAGDTVAVESLFAEPGAVVAGVIAPLLVDGSIVVGADNADHCVGDGGIDPGAITRRLSDGRSSRA